MRGVKLRYENPLVKRCFNYFALMRKEIGNDLARGTKKRHDQLRAAANFGIYPSTGLGKPHPLYGNLKGYYGISISGNFRLVVKPDTESLDPGSLKKCDSVLIEGVMDYHGQKHEWLIP
jgi:plasmid maintenance system killer protein